ncbi:MAG TPA: hypothetical protein VMW58_01540 [Anaerolineae bacterium]|nr:hypothetical protein [Anaerolineae bacterium]
MANVVTTINNVPVTITDDLDGTYSIDLSTQQARQFIRKELDQLREEKQELSAVRDGQEAKRLQYIAMRDSAVASKDEANAKIDNLNLRIAELQAFLQGLGDPT